MRAAAAVRLRGAALLREHAVGPGGAAAAATAAGAATVGGGEVLTWYACGPTVYDVAHLGHARTYLHTDIVRRVLTDFFALPVHFAMGITDVDDKIVHAARQRLTASGSPPASMSRTELMEEMRAVARAHEGGFFEDMDALGVRRPDRVLRVTEHLEEIVAYIDGILQRGNAYVAEGDGVYFDVDSLPSYGRLMPSAEHATTSTVTVGDGGEEGRDEEAGRASGSGKRTRRDFALWKNMAPVDAGWDSPWGHGRPGWHIECSAMTHAAFGEQLDMHSGGIDLKFPHHNNEIAQCEAFHGHTQPWVRHWLHTGHLFIAGRKMSKSLKNFISVREYLQRWDPALLRMYCLQNRYAASLHYGEERLQQAQAALSDFRRSLSVVDAATAAVTACAPRCKWDDAAHGLHALHQRTSQVVTAALADDIDTPTAMEALAHLAVDVERYARNLATSFAPVEPALSATVYLRSMLAVFGLPGFTGGSEPWRAAAGASAPTDYSSRSGSSSSGGDRNHDVLLDAVVELRSRARKAAGMLAKHGRAEAAEGMQQEAQAIFAQCDRVRDAARDAGITLEDGPGGKTLWYRHDDNPIIAQEDGTKDVDGSDR